jgi:7,8-dihydropterin-6-yl-methyl-4-(beta-D-ribofuranosyl)aminobenzene 5'-phosphate synthase
MNIKIIFDATAINDQFKTGWGFSCLINDNILFDTGDNGAAMVHNLNLMGVTDIKKIILSHQHYDHVGGLWDVLAMSHDKISVYGCPNFHAKFKEKVVAHRANFIAVEAFQEIEPNIFTTGEMSGVYKEFIVLEQSLVLKTARGLVVVTGCAHAEITSIVRRVQTNFPQDHIYVVLGGFHLYEKSISEITNVFKSLQVLGVEKIAPIHCTGDQAKEIGKKYFGGNIIDIRAGEALVLE